MVDRDEKHHLQCDPSLQRTIRCNLERFIVQPHSENGASKAAVALTVVDAGHGAGVYGLPVFDTPRREAALILTRRSTKLKNHSGQWALPGGRMEDGESAEEAAL